MESKESNLFGNENLSSSPPQQLMSLGCDAHELP